MLWRLGYRNLTKQQVSDALREIYEALEMSVGMRIAEQLNGRQLEEFEKIMATGIEDRGVAWLKETLPGYREVVRDEYDRLQRRLEGAVALARRQHRESPTGSGEAP